MQKDVKRYFVLLPTGDRFFLTCRPYPLDHSICERRIAAIPETAPPLVVEAMLSKACEQHSLREVDPLPEHRTFTRRT